MSTDLKSHAKDVSLTRFWGGSLRGSSVQVTQPNPNYDTDKGGHRFNYVQLTRAQAAALAADLLDFAQGREQEEV
tara:strand:- start:603 stop:827 length:225 start_codon:yes stop_codon:yes gene_type:complete